VCFPAVVAPSRFVFRRDRRARFRAGHGWEHDERRGKRPRAPGSASACAVGTRSCWTPGSRLSRIELPDAEPARLSARAKHVERQGRHSPGDPSPAVQSRNHENARPAIADAARRPPISRGVGAVRAQGGRGGPRAGDVRAGARTPTDRARRGRVVLPDASAQEHILYDHAYGEPPAGDGGRARGRRRARSPTDLPAGAGDRGAGAVRDDRSATRRTSGWRWSRWTCSGSPTAKRRAR